MTKTTKTGRTFFFTLNEHQQVAVHCTKDHHWTYQGYTDGIAQGRTQRARIGEIVDLLKGSKEFNSCNYDSEAIINRLKEMFVF